MQQALRRGAAIGLCGLGMGGTGLALRWAAGEANLPSSLHGLPEWLQRTPLPDVVTATALAGAALLVLYVSGVVLIAVLADCAGPRGWWWRSVALRLAPGPAGGLVRLALGAAVVSATVLPSTASAGTAAVDRVGAVMVSPPTVQQAPAGTGPATTREAATRPAPAPPLLDRPATMPASVAALPPAAGVPPPATRPAARPVLVPGAPTRIPPQSEVVVRRGDTLWTIAERHLRSLQGPVDASAVADAWPRWHAANRSVIGDDPALLLPGQRLLPPATP